MTDKFRIAPPSYHAVKPAEAFLYPRIAPFHENYLSVSSLHSLWFAQYGNPHGIPIVMVHGGPGGGCGPFDSRFFDPAIYRIILLDQRGAGHSRPNANVTDNHTNYLIDDMEQLRKHLDISYWLVCGGSWGSALSLAYGQAHPQRCLGFILRGIFLATQDEYMKLWNGMGDIYPEAFQEYVEFLSSHERINLLMSYHRRLMSDDPAVHMPAARAFYKYDLTCATLIDKSRIASNLLNAERVLALARIFAHYCVNNFFMARDQLIHNLHKIAHLPAMIIQGRYDVICRASSAFRLHQAWPGSILTIVPDAGHANLEPGITRAIVDAGEHFKTRLLHSLESRLSS